MDTKLVRSQVLQYALQTSEKEFTVPETKELSMRVIQPPSRGDLLKELRTGEVFPRLLFALPSLSRQPRGSGEPVMVLPGFSASDASTAILRNYIRYLDYDVRGWGLGTNRGNVEELLPQIAMRVESLASAAERPVRLVGWSLGGYLAREVARDYPDYVDHVVTLGSPVVGGPKYTAVAAYYKSQGVDVDAIEAIVDERYETPLTVPVTAIYSRADGVVAWEACVDERSPNVEHIEVDGTHLSLGFSPEVLRIVARRLARD